MTWPVNNKPSKEDRHLAQAKAQVAAENEKKAMEQNQQGAQESDDLLLEDVHQSGGGPSRPGSPSLPPHFRQTSAPDSPFGNRAKASSANSPPHQNASLPDPLLRARSCDTHDSERAQHNEPQQLPVSLLHGKAAPALQTPASVLSGAGVFSPDPSARDDTDAADDGPSLNHETGLHKHYTQQIAKHVEDRQKTAEELEQVAFILSRQRSQEKAKKKILLGTKVAAVSTTALTAGLLTAGIGLAAGLVFVGVTGSGAMVGGKMMQKARGRSDKSFRLIVGAKTYAEAVQWKMALEVMMAWLEEEMLERELGIDFTEPRGSTEDSAAVNVATVAVAAPKSPSQTMANANAIACSALDAQYQKKQHSNSQPHQHQPPDPTPEWVPIQGGGMALWGILGAMGGGNLRIYREERRQQTLSRVGLAGQPFPPFKASVSLTANSLDAFMCMMCSGRIFNDDDPCGTAGAPQSKNSSGGSGGSGSSVGSVHNSNGATNFQSLNIVPNSGQIASFRIVQTMDDHMDVIHLVFRPLYLFPCWTAPRDFVLYRFWKYDDDGTYQVCFDSGQHRDCPPSPGYVRGEMHSVCTITPRKRGRKKPRTGTTPGAAAASSAGLAPHHNPLDEECLLSCVVQVDPRGWVPAASSLPFLQNQGYGDAFGIMALHQMLDVKEALDTARFVTVPTESSGGAHGVHASGVATKKRVEIPGRLLSKDGREDGSTSIEPLGGLAMEASSGSAKTRRCRSPPHLEQQLHVPALETYEYSADDELESYGHKYLKTQHSADGYHQSPPELSSSSSANVGTLLRSLSYGKIEDAAVEDKGVVKYSNFSTLPPPMP